VSDTQKYYYIKLKDSYFEQDNIKILESMPNGYIYSLILLKLYLKSAKHQGRLMMTHDIPYDPHNIDSLAHVLNHDKDHLKEAIKQGSILGLITVINSEELWLTEIENFIGQSSSEADRKRTYRTMLETRKLGVEDKCPDKIPPELEIEREIELERDKEIKTKKHRYGEYKNVLLTDKEYEELEVKVDDREHWIQTCDEYCEQTGKKYKNYSLAIQNWYKKDLSKLPPKPSLERTLEEMIALSEAPNVFDQ